MKKYIKLLLLLLCMSAIFYFSAQPAADSTVQTNVVVDILYKIYAFVFEADRESYNEFVNIWFTPTRKLAHFSEFAVLGILMYLNLSDRIKNKLVLYSVLYTGLYAVSDEIHQYFVPGRYCAIKDMLIDTSGALFGIVLIHLLSKRWRKN